MELALPGRVICYDYRSNITRNEPDTIPQPLRAVQWNIERGYKLDEVISVLRKIDADILCLQEIDIGNERSGCTNHARIIAECLGLNCGIVIEFQELKSPCRTPDQQGGGIHGNAILSKFDMNFRVIDHKHQPYNWSRDGMLLGEPRHGRRYTLVADIHVPMRPQILVYSSHFECFTGIVGRVGQLCDLIADSKYHAEHGRPHQLIFGDLNTFAHSLARFSPKYATGWYRWRSIGMTEPEWWMQNILSWYSTDGPINLVLKGVSPSNSLKFSDSILRNAVNPGWYDPFDIMKDITISNHAGLMTAKADWTFVRQMKVEEHWMENRNFSISDHRCLVLDIEFAHSEILDGHKKATKLVARELYLKRRSKFWTYFTLSSATALSYLALRLARTSTMSVTHSSV